jgi:hypothetical protein
MHIRVIRDTFNDTCTLGKMYVDGADFAHTLEDKYRGQLENEADKVHGETAIPCGTYKVFVDHSEHFGRDLPHIIDVPRFAGVRIHGGNRSEDTLGCILIGRLTNGVDAISDCKERVETLTKMICDADECTIEIVNAIGAV